MEWGKALSFLENNYQREAMGSFVFAKKIISLHSNFLLLHRINYTTEFSFCKLGGTITHLCVKVGISKRWKIPSQSLSFFFPLSALDHSFALHCMLWKETAGSLVSFETVLLFLPCFRIWITKCQFNKGEICFLLTRTYPLKVRKLLTWTLNNRGALLSSNDELPCNHLLVITWRWPRM